MIWPLSSKETPSVRGKFTAVPGSPRNHLWPSVIMVCSPMRSTGPPGQLSHPFFTATISNSVSSLQDTYPDTNASLPGDNLYSHSTGKAETTESHLLHPADLQCAPSLFLFSWHVYQSTKIAVTSAAHGLTFSHSLIWPRHNLILKRTSIILKKYSYCYLVTHWLVWILHFSQTTLVISILGTLPGCFPLFAY